MNKKKTIKIIIIILLIVVFKIQIVIDYEYEILTENKVLDDIVEIRTFKIDGGKTSDYLLFKVLHNDLYPENISIYLQGNQKPLGDKIKVDINKIYLSIQNTDFKQIEKKEEIKKNLALWYADSHGRDLETVEKEEIGIIDKNFNQDLNSEYFSMYIDEKLIGGSEYYIELNNQIKKLLKVGSEIKLKISITNESGEKSLHDVIYKINNVKKNISIWWWLYYDWMGI